MKVSTAKRLFLHPEEEDLLRFIMVAAYEDCRARTEEEPGLMRMADYIEDLIARLDNTPAEPLVCRPMISLRMSFDRDKRR